MSPINKCSPNEILHRAMTYKWLVLCNQRTLDSYQSLNLTESGKLQVEAYQLENDQALATLNLDEVEQTLSALFPTSITYPKHDEHPLFYLLFASLRYNGVVGKLTYEGCAYVNHNDDTFSEASGKIQTNSDKIAYIEAVYDYTVAHYEITPELLNESIMEEAQWH